MGKQMLLSFEEMMELVATQQQGVPTLNIFRKKHRNILQLKSTLRNKDDILTIILIAFLSSLPENWRI